jgi:hypothetical protein
VEALLALGGDRVDHLAAPAGQRRRDDGATPGDPPAQAPPEP